MTPPLDGLLKMSSIGSKMRNVPEGLGKALLEQGLNYAQAADAPSVWLTTNLENTPAIAFYLKHGFRKVGTTHFRIHDQVYLNDVFRRLVMPV